MFASAVMKKQIAAQKRGDCNLRRRDQRLVIPVPPVQVPFAVMFRPTTRDVMLAMMLTLPVSFAPDVIVARVVPISWRPDVPRARRWHHFIPWRRRTDAQFHVDGCARDGRRHHQSRSDERSSKRSVWTVHKGSFQSGYRNGDGTRYEPRRRRCHYELSHSSRLSAGSDSAVGLEAMSQEDLPTLP